MTKFEMEEKIVAMLKTVYDPEIPVNLYDLGLIYKIDVSDKFEVNIEMTLTAPNCPAADFIVEDVRQRIESIDGVTATNINLVFEPMAMDCCAVRVSVALPFSSIPPS